MRSFFIWIAFAGLIFSSTVGCSIHAMNSKPPPIPIDSLTENPSRGELISLFGPPVTSDVDQTGDKSDYFKFTDGYHGATKARALLYVAGDVFTLGLAELIFWPLEVNTMIGKEGTAIATYNKNNVAKKLEIKDEDGKPWDVNWRTPPPAQEATSDEETENM